MRRRACLPVSCLALALAGFPPAEAGDEPPPAEAWTSFSGSWSASGRRLTVAVEGGGVAVIVEVSGPVVLASGEGLSRGFRGHAIAFDDGQGLSVGRSVWTDEKGDQLFSRLKGEPVEAGKRVFGTITGGTGRYAALQGEYSFTWQYVVATEDGQFQGRAVSLSGRARRVEALR
jgi:hypothetical protein